ncbi:hypothetical protein [Caldiplasma sukawensis]
MIEISGTRSLTGMKCLSKSSAMDTTEQGVRQSPRNRHIYFSTTTITR